MTLAREARSLLAAVHAALVADDGPDAAASFLSAAPAAECQRLADMWDAAAPAERDDARDSLTVENQIVLDIVVGTYPPARPDSHPDLNLGDLLDPPAPGPTRS